MFADTAAFRAFEPFPITELEITTFSREISITNTLIRCINKSYCIFVTSPCIRSFIFDALTGWNDGCPIGTFTWKTILIASWSIIFSKFCLSVETSCLKCLLKKRKIVEKTIEIHSKSKSIQKSTSKLTSLSLIGTHSWKSILVLVVQLQSNWISPYEARSVLSSTTFETWAFRRKFNSPTWWSNFSIGSMTSLTFLSTAVSTSLKTWSLMLSSKTAKNRMKIYSKLYFCYHLDIISDIE